MLNHVFKGNTVTDRDSTQRANCAKQVTEGQCQKSVLLQSVSQVVVVTKKLMLERSLIVLSIAAYGS